MAASAMATPTLRAIRGALGSRSLVKTTERSMRAYLTHGSSGVNQPENGGSSALTSSSISETREEIRLTVCRLATNSSVVRSIS